MVNRIILGCGALAVALLACGGQGRDPADSGARDSSATGNIDPGVVTRGSQMTEEEAAAEAARECLGSAGEAPVSLSFCRVCVPGVVPRCLGRPMPKPETEPPACAAPDCEVPSDPAAMIASLDGAIDFSGACADGKTFRATLGPLGGVVRYYTSGGGLAGTAAYSPVVLRCECSGEAFNGDVRCDSPTFEGIPPGGEPLLPFASGRASVPCWCAD